MKTLSKILRRCPVNGCIIVFNANERQFRPLARGMSVRVMDAQVAYGWRKQGDDARPATRDFMVSLND